MIVWFCLFTIVASQWSLCLGSVRPNSPDDSLRQPLILTPLIEARNLATAREKSIVLPLPGSPPSGVSRSYSGFLTVNKKYNSNLFFWYFPAQVSNTSGVPILLWLQGGPGASSLFGLFVEHGPIVVTEDLKLKPREYAWTSEFHVVYIDQPVGAGFSFTDSEEGYAKNQSMVSDDLYQALIQFFTLFPELQQSDFYITGQSYAGKYISTISHKLHQEKPGIIRFRGLAIGNAWIDPKSYFIYSEYLYQLGLIDENHKRNIKVLEHQVQKYISRGDWNHAMHGFLDLMFSVYSYADLKQHFNILYTKHPEDHSYYNKYLKMESVRSAIHVGEIPHKYGHIVYNHMFDDFMKSAAPMMAELMDEYKVLLYSGQFDIVVPYPLTMSFMLNLNWNGSGDFKNATRNIWKVDDSDKEVAGYVRRAKHVYQVLIRNAGHNAPYDQPRATLDMIIRFVKGRTFSNSVSRKDFPISNTNNFNFVSWSFINLLQRFPWFKGWF